MKPCMIITLALLSACQPQVEVKPEPITFQASPEQHAKIAEEKLADKGNME